MRLFVFFIASLMQFELDDCWRLFKWYPINSLLSKKFKFNITYFHEDMKNLLF